MPKIRFLATAVVSLWSYLLRSLIADLRDLNGVVSIEAAKDQLIIDLLSLFQEYRLVK